MPSPFPGMNPYLEQRPLWRGFHGRFLVFLQNAIEPLLPPAYLVEYEETVYIERPDDEPPAVAVADVRVSGPDRERRPADPAPPVAAPVTATVALPAAVRRSRHWLSIRDADRRAVVTVVELLSPSDKRAGRDRDRYLTKRARVLGSRASLVEIDLLRGGERMPVQRPPACDYLAMVSRRAERPRVGLWPVGLRDELPAVPLPLRPGEPEPVVPLKAVLDAAYDGAGYARRIYAGRPDPPLSAADADWARQFLPATG